MIASAKAGGEDGWHMMGHSCAIAPSHVMVVLSRTGGDDLLHRLNDLDAPAE